MSIGDDNPHLATAAFVATAYPLTRQAPSPWWRSDQVMARLVRILLLRETQGLCLSYKDRFSLCTDHEKPLGDGPGRKLFSSTRTNSCHATQAYCMPGDDHITTNVVGGAPAMFLTTFLLCCESNESALEHSDPCPEAAAAA